MTASNKKGLNDLLRAVSRSFYLTLRVVPRPVRKQLGTAYLFCRAADTIADTRLLPPAERLAHLAAFREQFAEDRAPDVDVLRSISKSLSAPLEIPEERELLERLDECFDAYLAFDAVDRGLVQRLVTTLTEGMAFDLRTFPSESSGELIALPDDAALDQYCYHVAGCVGEFWTDLQCRHLRPLRHWDVDVYRDKGITFGRALQMTNILRDADKDFAIGRCYFPQVRLASAATSVEAIAANDRSALREVVHGLIRRTLDQYRIAWEYTLAIPRRVVSMRLACIWPLWIGLETLAAIAREDEPCAPGKVVKIRRPDVYRIMRSSALRSMSNRSLERRYRRLEDEVSNALA